MRRVNLMKLFGAATLLAAAGLNLYSAPEEVAPPSEDSILGSSEAAKPEKEKPVYFVGEYDPKRDPAKDLKGALELAKKEKKHVLIQVGGDWCGWCQLMTNYFHENKPVREALLKNYVVMKVNYSTDNKNEAFLKAYPQVPAFPHLFVLDAKGKVLCSQYTGDLEAEGSYSEKIMLKFLNQWTPEAMAEKKATEEKKEENAVEAVSDSTVESKTNLLPLDLEAVSLSQGENSNNTNMVLVYTDGEKRYMDRSKLEALIRGTVSFEWVDRDSISDVLIKDIMEKKRSFMGAVVEPKAVTRSTVNSHVDRSINMAAPPVKGVELDDFFLFSGGTRDRPVDDFSTGYAVDKKTGEILRW